MLTLKKKQKAEFAFLQEKIGRIQIQYGYPAHICVSKGKIGQPPNFFSTSVNAFMQQGGAIYDMNPRDLGTIYLLLVSPEN